MKNEKEQIGHWKNILGKSPQGQARSGRGMIGAFEGEKIAIAQNLKNANNH